MILDLERPMIKGGGKYKGTRVQYTMDYAVMGSSVNLAGIQRDKCLNVPGGQSIKMNSIGSDTWVDVSMQFQVGKTEGWNC